MNRDNIPNELHFLIPFVIKWGIEDDGKRDEFVFSSNKKDLQNLTDSISDQIMEKLNKWLSDKGEIEKSTDEFIKFTCLLKAYEYAVSLLIG